MKKLSKKDVAGRRKIRGTDTLVGAESYYSLAREKAFDTRGDGDGCTIAELCLLSIAGSLTVLARGKEGRAK